MFIYILNKYTSQLLQRNNNQKFSESHTANLSSKPYQQISLWGSSCIDCDFVVFKDADDFDEINVEEDSLHEYARIFGTEHPWFWRIHVTALVSLGKKSKNISFAVVLVWG